MNLTFRDSVVGSLVLLVAHLPFMREVLLQLTLPGALYERLSDAQRASFPDAPAESRGLVFASMRFHRAFWQYVTVDQSGESSEIAALKRALRRSMKRKVVFAVAGFAVGVALVIGGWHPWRP